MVNSKHWELLRIGHQSKDWELVKILEILREMASLREPKEKAKDLLDRAVDLVDGEENHTTRQMRANFRDNHGHSLLMIAAQMGDKRHVAKLREHGGHVSLKDTHNRNAFHFLGLRGKKDAEETADILHILAGPVEDYCPLVSMLRDPVPVEISLNAPTHNGTRPLHIAASSGTTALAQRMPVIGADPNAEDGIGQTPIFKAVQNGHAHVVQALIEQEASPSTRTNLAGRQSTTRVTGPTCRRCCIARSRMGLAHSTQMSDSRITIRVCRNRFRPLRSVALRTRRRERRL
jgi:ankyrin repeat protein